MSDAPPARNYEPDQIVPGTKYKVMRLIGAGGMGTVYDVEDTSIGKRYVLKTLHPQLGSREDLARRMQQEARTLARLSHPNIVEVITAGVTGRRSAAALLRDGAARRGSRCASCSRRRGSSSWRTPITSRSTCSRRSTSRTTRASSTAT